MVSHDYVGKGRVLPRLGGGLSPRRRIAGAVVGAVLLAALTPVLTALRDHTTLASDALIYLVVVVVVALIGGLYPGPRGGHRQRPAAQLVLHPAHPQLHDSQRQRRRRPHRVRRRRGAGELRRQRGGPAQQARRRGPVQRPRPSSPWPAACCAASRRCRRCWSGCWRRSPCTSVSLLAPRRARSAGGWSVRRQRAGRGPVPAA